VSFKFFIALIQKFFDIYMLIYILNVDCHGDWRAALLHFLE